MSGKTVWLLPCASLIELIFYDLKGTYQRSFTYGKEPIVPLLKKNDTQVDVLGTTKCFIDICGTDQYVYCLYDGSVDFF